MGLPDASSVALAVGSRLILKEKSNREISENRIERTPTHSGRHKEGASAISIDGHIVFVIGVAVDRLFEQSTVIVSRSIGCDLRKMPAVAGS
jgi:hypothetical protein